MRKLTALTGMLVLVLAACGGGEGASNSGVPTSDADAPDVAGACLAGDPNCDDIGDPNADPNAPSDASDEPITPSASLSAAQVLAAGTIDGSFVVSGYLFVDADGNARLCDMVLESYPPQCGGDSIPVAGDLSDLELTSDQGVSWSDSTVSLEGTFDGTTFTRA
ncbi:MAG: hypothetical protein WD532_11875 [Acidimicrobiia bacterium]